MRKVKRDNRPPPPVPCSHWNRNFNLNVATILQFWRKYTPDLDNQGDALSTRVGIRAINAYSCTVVSGGWGVRY